MMLDLVSMSQAFHHCAPMLVIHARGARETKTPHLKRTPLLTLLRTCADGSQDRTPTTTNKENLTAAHAVAGARSQLWLDSTERQAHTRSQLTSWPVGHVLLPSRVPQPASFWTARASTAARIATAQQWPH